ncbi:hypothetical protein An16g02270 [Aspergillus niger]|uniref:Uncharacterized protein n=2 Tax=Aspergillus niger TaxID=5061 RepID=A2R748_ASPNC|nr:hypothetical protein An16g02270 [Aspergillus niger]CAL00451.1 hypothetical protein An16g02270 [Aspergillus niger]
MIKPLFTTITKKKQGQVPNLEPSTTGCLMQEGQNYAPSAPCPELCQPTVSSS